MKNKLYRLYYYYGGMTDSYKVEYESNKIENVLIYNIKHRNETIYNGPNLNYKPYIEIIKCTRDIYKAQPVFIIDKIETKELKKFNEELIEEYLKE